MLQPGQFGVTAKASYMGCCLKNQGQGVMPEDRVEFLRWHVTMSALLVVDTLELATVQRPGQVSDKPVYCSLY